MDFDVFMIAYRERNAAANWARLRDFAPGARMIRGVRGIFAAHAACAAAARTPWFFVVDADNWVRDGFDFTVPFQPDPDEVATWDAVNPVNGLRYGHGGIKLFPRDRFAAAAGREIGLDMPVGLAARNRAVDVLASEHRFNADPFTTWSTAMRECVKLAVCTTRGGFKARALSRARLDAWCSRGGEAPFGEWCLLGAREGHGYGLKFYRDLKELLRINDYDWMRFAFQRRHEAKLAGGTAAAAAPPESGV